MGTTYPPDGWNVYYGTWGTDFDRDEAVRLSGSYSIKFEDTTPANTPYLLQEAYPTSPGTPVMVTAVVSADSTTATNHVIVGVWWYDSDDTYLDVSMITDAAVSAASTWETKTAVVTAPASAASYRVIIGKTKTAFNAWFDSVESGDFPKGFSAYLSGNQSVTSTAKTLVAFNAEEYDAGGVFNTASSLFTAQDPGFYVVSANTSIGAQSGKVYACFLVKNGSTDVLFDSSTAGAGDENRIISKHIFLSAGDTLGIYVQSDDSTYTIYAAYSSFSVTRL